MIQGRNISVIIPVFNEEKTVASVVKAVLDSGFAAEVICVNDGSTDKSKEVLEGFGDKIKLISFVKNHGKGAALAVGVRAARGEIVVFLDADLIGLEKKHLEKLVLPLLTEKARGVIGQIYYGKDFLAQLKVFSGERAYWRKDLLGHLDEIAKTRYGVEIYLNSIFKRRRVRTVSLKGLGQTIKYKKMNFSEASKDYLKEGKEMIKTASKIEKVKMEKLNHALNRKISIEDVLRLLSQFRDKKVVRELRTYLSRVFDDGT